MGVGGNTTLAIMSTTVPVVVVPAGAGGGQTGDGLEVVPAGAGACHTESVESSLSRPPDTYNEIAETEWRRKLYDGWGGPSKAGDSYQDVEADHDQARLEVTSTSADCLSGAKRTALTDLLLAEHARAAHFRRAAAQKSTKKGPTKGGGKHYDHYPGDHLSSQHVSIQDMAFFSLYYALLRKQVGHAAGQEIDRQIREKSELWAQWREDYHKKDWWNNVGPEDGGDDASVAGGFPFGAGNPPSQAEKARQLYLNAQQKYSAPCFDLARTVCGQLFQIWRSDEEICKNILLQGHRGHLALLSRVLSSLEKLCGLIKHVI